MGEFAAMNITTIKAKALLAAKQIEHEIGDGVTGCNVAGIIEDVFVNTHVGDKSPIFAMAPFSGVVGCGIYRIGDPGKLIAIVPPQAPFGLEMTPNAVSARALHRVDAIKQETEHVARLILQALNAS